MSPKTSTNMRVRTTFRALEAPNRLHKTSTSCFKSVRARLGLQGNLQLLKMIRKTGTRTIYLERISLHQWGIFSSSNLSEAIKLVVSARKVVQECPYRPGSRSHPANHQNHSNSSAPMNSRFKRQSYPKTYVTKSPLY